MASLTLLLSACSAVTPSSYHVSKTVSIPGEVGWDYATIDSNARHVFISHKNEVVVLDADSGIIEGKIPNTLGVHGIALAPDLNRGFISDGKANNVMVFNLKTLKSLYLVKVGNNPDAILYDSSSQHVFAFNGKSDSVSVINAKTGKKITDIKLLGAPEFAVADGEGHVYVNLENKNELLKIDAKNAKIIERWPVAPGEAPSSIAIDRKNHRLFVGCGNKILLVVNADTGKIITTLPIGEHVDATAFDESTKNILSSNGEGTLTIIHQDSPESYKYIETLRTRKGSRTFALDPKTHRLFMPAAEFGSPPTPTKENPHPHPTAVPGSFAVMILDQ